jgi:hypothetical protein
MWEVENYIEGEKKEMVEIYEAKGVSKEDATTLVDVLSRYKVHHTIAATLQHHNHHAFFFLSVLSDDNRQYLGFVCGRDDGG